MEPGLQKVYYQAVKGGAGPNFAWLLVVPFKATQSHIGMEGSRHGG
jgi:hypothetical protein